MKDYDKKCENAVIFFCKTSSNKLPISVHGLHHQGGNVGRAVSQ
jgi:hypothetical protein